MALEATFEDHRFGETVLAAQALNEGQPLTLGVDVQNFELLVLAAWHSTWGEVGGGLGVGALRTAFQETQPVPIFLKTTAVGLRSAVYGQWAHGPLTLGSRLNLQVPNSIDQSPLASGEATGLAYGVQVYGLWTLGDHWALRVAVGVMLLDLESTGEGDHIDSVSVPGEELSYSVALQDDTLKSVLLGVRTRF